MRLYRALLRAYPASFRAEYGTEMAALFARRRRDTRGFVPAVTLWLDAVRDVLTNAARAHVDILRQDMAFAFRSVRRSPGFAATAVTVAALGIGATTSAFSITDYVLLRPLPFARADRLVMLWQAQGRYTRNELSPANYRDWKATQRSFAAVGAFSPRAVNLVGDGEPERVDGAAVTAEVLPLLGVPPAVGRVFGDEDAAPDAPAAVVLGHSLWKARFGGSDVIGRKVLVDGAPHVVIGVMPASFHFPNRDAELWTSLRFGAMDYEDRTNTYVTGIARLRNGVAVEAARSEMRLVTAQLERAFPADNAGVAATVNRLRDELPAQARLLPLALLGAAGCLLLIACTNLTHLLLARAMVRRKELAVRTALGAGRERLVRQLVTESLLLAVAGGTLGVLIAVLAVPVLARLVPNSLPVAETPPMDLRVLAFALTATVATGIAFGVLPAWRAWGSADASGLREGARAGVGGRRARARSGLIVAEVTASVVLLFCCGLLLRALWHVEGVNPGFRADGVVTVRTALPQPRYASTAARTRFYARVLSEVRALPGVTAAGYITGLPMVMRGGIWEPVVPGEAPLPGERPKAALRFVTPGFFATLGIPVRAGRDIGDADTFEARPYAAVVSESFARLHWPGQDPIGRRFEFALAEREIVGVVPDVRVRGLEQASEPQIYLSHQQVADDSISGYTPKDLAIRAEAQGLDILPAVRDIVGRADPEQPISDARLLSDIVSGETAPRRVQVRVLGGFAAVAFLLAAIGIHGLLSFAVSSRTHEIGVRIALGARSAHILSMVLHEGLKMAAAGIALGLFLSYAAGRGMGALLGGIHPEDPATFAAATTLAAVMTLAGTLLPALRAVRVSPLEVMRSE